VTSVLDPTAASVVRKHRPSLQPFSERFVLHNLIRSGAGSAWLLGASLLVAGSCASAPTSAPPAERFAADVALPADTAVRAGVLANGLRYYIRRNAEPRDRVELRLAVNAGSVLEDPDQRGLAHVVEHMAFNGTENFEGHELVGFLESVGMRFGPDVNAYTSFDETVYMLTLPTDTSDVVETGFRILEDWAHRIRFDSLEVERERAVVIEEWRLGQGAGSRMRDVHFPVLFRGSRYAERLPIGTRESLETFDHAALRRFYRDWYRPDLMSVTVVGEIDPDRAQALIEQHFGGIEAPRRARVRAEVGFQPTPGTRYSIATDPEATGTSVSLYLKWPARPGGTPRAYRDWIRQSLTSAMLNSRLHEIAQQPGAPVLDVSSFQGRLVRPTDALILTASVPDGGAARGLEAVLVEMHRAAQHGFTQSELDRERAELIRILEQRHAERARTTSSEYASQYVSHFLYGGSLIDADTEWELYRTLAPQITLEEVDSLVAEWAAPGDRAVLVSASRRDESAPPTEAELAAAVATAAAMPLTAWEDGESDAPLLRERPRAGRIVAEREVPEAGVLEWQLENGARVLLRPTDFRDDEILFAGRRDGGTSRFDDRDHVAALTAAAIAQYGGAGELSLTELRKRLAGRLAGAGASIDQLQETLSGGASPRDIETLFELIHLRFTAPRVDTTAFLTYRDQARERLRNRGLSPDDAFQDTLQTLLTGGHPRARPPSAAIFDSLDLHRSIEIYRDRFGDAGRFTFYFVGTFEPDSLRPLVETYLASLPARSDTVGSGWRDLGVRPPDGVVRRTVLRGSEPRARTQFVFHGPMEFGRDELQSLDALATLLQIRLREVLREDRGGTYNVGVSASGTRDPIPQYRLAIGFGADPDRVDELADALFAELAEVQRAGPSEAEIARVREIRYRAREVQLRENGFWIGQIMTYDRLGWDLAEIPATAQRSEEFDAERIREAARRYLNTDRFIQVTLLPQDTTTGATSGSRPVTVP
jgi:zinc protease